MTKPSMEEVKKMAVGYDLVPIQEEIFADMVTPILLLRKIAASKKNYYLLLRQLKIKKYILYNFKNAWCNI